MPRKGTPEWARVYGSEERVEWVKSRPCIVPGCENTDIENAHTPSRSGYGRKGDAKYIVPLCSEHHTELDDEIGPGPFEEKHDIVLADEAARTDADWKTHLHGLAF